MNSKEKKEMIKRYLILFIPLIILFIGPYLGKELKPWFQLIGVTLAMISGGYLYATHPKNKDRNVKRDIIIIAGGGLLTGAIAIYFLLRFRS